LAKAAHVRAVYHVMGGCPPTHSPAAGVSAAAAQSDACTKHNSELLDLAGQFKYVVLGGYWSFDNNPAFETELNVVAARIVRAGAIPVVFRDIPQPDRDLSQCVLRKARGWIPPETNCNIPYATVRAAQARDNDAIDRVRQKFPQLIVIDPKEMLCNATECVSRVGNLAVYMDAQHLNAQAAQALAASYLGSHRNPISQ
jgi:hypothetical protein